MQARWKVSIRHMGGRGLNSKGKAKLVVVSDDASEATKERISKLCKNRRVDLVIFGNKEELGSSIGQSNRAIVAITDSRFKEMILDVLPDAVKVNMGVLMNGKNKSICNSK